MNNSATATDKSSTLIFTADNSRIGELRQIVINLSYGGFNLSAKALSEYRTLANIPMTEPLHDGDIRRDDIFLVQVVEALKDEANGKWCQLKIVEIPSHIEWSIQEYDGAEWVAEKHRTWR